MLQDVFRVALAAVLPPHLPDLHQLLPHASLYDIQWMGLHSDLRWRGSRPSAVWLDEAPLQRHPI